MAYSLEERRLLLSQAPTPAGLLPWRGTGSHQLCGTHARSPARPFSVAPTVTENKGAVHRSSFKTAIVKIWEILWTHGKRCRLGMSWPRSQGVWAQTPFMDLENFVQGFRPP